MWWTGRIWWWVECDAQPDLDIPAGDPDVFDEQAQQLLFLGVVEGVDDGVDAGGEVMHAAAELVVAGELGSFVGQTGSLVLQLLSARCDFGRAALHFGQFDEPTLVEVDEATPFGIGASILRSSRPSSAARSSSSGMGVVRVTACSPASSWSGWVIAARMCRTRRRPGRRRGCCVQGSGG